MAVAVRKLSLFFVALVLSLALLILVMLKFDRDIVLKPAEAPKLKFEREPMVMSVFYGEQMANALKNLFDLQCWAGTVNISKVVEPSINTNPNPWSVLLSTFDEKSFEFSDLYDISLWNGLSEKHGHSSLASMKYFFEHSVRRVVFVLLNYALGNERCLHNVVVTNQWWYKILEQRGFIIVKTVCIDFVHSPSHIMSEAAFSSQIYEGVGHNVSGLFGECVSMLKELP